MPLLRTVARTTVVAGTATAVSNGVSRRQQSRWQEKEVAAQQQEPAAQQPPAAPAAAASAGMSSDAIAKLKELAELRDAGVLTPAEFEVQKEKILAG